MTDWSVPNTEEHLPFFFPMLSPMVTRANLVLSLDIFFYFCFCFTFLQESLIPSAFRIVRESSLQTFAIYITHSWTQSFSCTLIEEKQIEDTFIPVHPGRCCVTELWGFCILASRTPFFFLDPLSTLSFLDPVSNSQGECCSRKEAEG